jgi:hypothetical protein
MLDTGTPQRPSFVGSEAFLTSHVTLLVQPFEHAYAFFMQVQIPSNELS